MDGEPLSLSLRRSLLLWMLAEVHWLLWAYLLEFKGLPLRPAVWMARKLRHRHSRCEATPFSMNETWVGDIPFGKLMIVACRS